MMQTNIKNYQYLLFIGMLFVVVNTVADLLVYKMIKIGPFLMSIGVFVVPFSYAICDIVAEVYGYTVARKIIWFGLLSEFLFDAIGYLTALPVSPGFVNNDAAFNTIMHPLLHIYVIVFAANVISDFANVYFLSKWKILLKGRYFWLRSIGSSGIAQLIFTVICDGLVFIHALSVPHVLQTILSTFTIKMLCAIILSGPMSIIVALLKYKEGADIYDDETDFNPFKLTA